MRVVLVTVTGPSARRDLALPADVPSRTLLSPLAQLLAEPTGVGAIDPSGRLDGGWELRSMSGAPIPPELTLPDAGVTAGAYLQLDRVHPTAAVPVTPPASRAQPPAPAVTAGRVGLPGRDRAARWRGALTALRTPTPTAASGPSSPGRWQRAEQAWQTAGYHARLRAGIAAATLDQPITVAVLAPARQLGVSTITGLLAATLTDLGVGPVQVLGQPAGEAAAPAATAGTAAGGVVLVDGDPGFGTPAHQLAVAYADQLVVITDTDPVTAAHAVRAARSPLTGGQPVTVVVNHPGRRPGRLDIARLTEVIPAASGPVVVPYDPAAAGRIAIGELGGSWRWRRAGLELAWLLVGSWTRPETARPPPPTTGPSQRPSSSP
jgi:WXG100 protein secretion system (Wss), protein YukD